MTDAGGTPPVRVDTWLWRARFFRTRALSAEHVRKSGVRVSHAGQTRRTGKPGATLAVGDIVTFGRGIDIVTVEVLDLGLTRGPAELARSLYRRVEPEA